MSDTDERAALVERVALAMYQADDYYVSHAHAIAAISLIRAEVLEEAARVAEDAIPMTQDSESDHYAAFCESIAAAIRALKDKP